MNIANYCVLIGADAGLLKRCMTAEEEVIGYERKVIDLESQLQLVQQRAVTAETDKEDLIIENNALSEECDVLRNQLKDNRTDKMVRQLRLQLKSKEEKMNDLKEVIYLCTLCLL